MQVDLSQVSKSEAPTDCLYAITFTLISGESPPTLLSLSALSLQETFADLEEFVNTSRAWSALPGEPRQPRPGPAGGLARGVR